MKIRLLLPLAAMSLLFLQACSEAEQEPVAQIKAVKTMVVTKTIEANTRRLSGVVQTADESNISFRVGGRVVAVNVERGQSVEQGQILAKLEQKDYMLVINSAKAKLQSARTELSTKTQENKRQQDLLKQSFVSKAEAERATAEYEEALSGMAVAETDLQTAEDNLKRTILRAPFVGKIGTKEIEAFREIAAGETAFVIQGSDGLEVEILVPETMIRQLDYGDIASVSFPILKNTSIGATITQIGARSVSGNAYPVTLKLADTETDIRPGITAEVALRVKNKTGQPIFLIPTSAIDLRFFDQQTASLKEEGHVFVVDSESSTLKSQTIAINDLRGNQLEVTSGLEEGDRIVVAGVPFLSEGQKVKLWEPQYSIPATLNK